MAAALPIASDFPRRAALEAAPLIAARGLERRFGDVVVGPVDLELTAGERVALRGANGAGKTTLLRCLAGTLDPSRGTAWIGGHPAGAAPARALVGSSLGQERSFDVRLSGRENLFLYAALRGASRRDVGELEDELELGAFAERAVGSYSAGMAQQLAFARALLGEPAVLLLDEPTRSLDEEATRRLWDALARRPAAALLLATHRDADVRRCDREVWIGA